MIDFYQFILVNLDLIKWLNIMQYFRRSDMQDTQLALQKEALNFPDFDPDNLQDHHQLLKRRLYDAQPSARAYFVRKVVEYITGQTWDERARKYALLAELNVTCTYLENQILDRKYDIRSQEAINHNLIDTKLLAIQTNTYIRNSFQQEEKYEVLQLMEEVYLHNIIGEKFNKFRTTDFNLFEVDSPTCYQHSPQVDDLVNVDEFMEVLLLHSATKDIPQKNFLRLYLTRSYLVNGALFELFTRQLIHIYGEKSKPYQELIDFARFYGVIMQLINDIADFVPSSYDQKTPTKRADDALSDLRDRHITLPIMLYLNQKDCSARIKHFIKGYHEWFHVQGLENQFLLLRELKQQKALSKSMSMVAKLASFAENILSSNNTSTSYFNDMLSFAKGNRYFKILNQAKVSTSTSTPRSYTPTKRKTVETRRKEKPLDKATSSYRRHTFWRVRKNRSKPSTAKNFLVKRRTF